MYNIKNSYNYKVAEYLIHGYVIYRIGFGGGTMWLHHSGNTLIIHQNLIVIELDKFDIINQNLTKCCSLKYLITLHSSLIDLLIDPLQLIYCT